jgi:methionyl aminopeptidase
MVMHEGPEVPNYGRKGTGKKFLDGMVLAIEPMINQGTHRIKQLNDGWTILTADRKASAHFEHNVALIDGKPELLSSFQYIYSALGIISDEEEGLRKNPLLI